MTDHDAGYLQALMDMQMAIRRLVNDLGASPEGKVELLGVVSFLDHEIKTRLPADAGKGEGKQEAPDPLSGSF